MDKAKYREFFKKLLSRINFSAIYKEVGVKQPNFSSFMSGFDGALSEEKIGDIANECFKLAQTLDEGKKNLNQKEN